MKSNVEKMIAGEVYRQEEEFYASIVYANDAELLHICDGAPILHLKRTTFNSKNEIIEYTDSVARADETKAKDKEVNSLYSYE
ncbi:UTRA domain-containing protein [Enterococcus mundtii]|uniref:UTRA domain-containing protein n=1 Tax=Enterococcus mundtii TaxID=53346 RepID=UPI0002E2F229